MDAANPYIGASGLALGRRDQECALTGTAARPPGAPRPSPGRRPDDSHAQFGQRRGSRRLPSAGVRHQFIAPWRHRNVDDRGLRIFGRLSREQAERLADLFDEGLLLRRPDLGRMREITGPSFADADLDRLAKLYLDLLMTKISAAARRDVDSGAGLDDGDKRSLLADIAEKMRGAADAGRMRDNLTLSTIGSIGHPHIGRLDVYTEFRPLSSGPTIKRLVPQLVVDCIVHEGGRAPERPMKLQMSLADAQAVVKDIQSGIDTLKREIGAMRDKFGDDVVHD